MCLAIMNAKTTLPPDYFEEAAWRNDDGLGLLWAQGGKLHTHKAMQDTDKCVDKFYQKYCEVRRSVRSPILIHFRLATHGTLSLDGCHPFLVNEKLGFIHNGIFNNVRYDKELSDTQVFNRDVLQKLPGNFLRKDGFMPLLKAAAHGSKLVFLDARGNPTIVNEKDGHWKDGDWFSNSSYAEDPDSDWEGFGHCEYCGEGIKVSEFARGLTKCEECREVEAEMTGRNLMPAWAEADGYSQRNSPFAELMHYGKD